MQFILTNLFIMVIVETFEVSVPLRVCDMFCRALRIRPATRLHINYVHIYRMDFVHTACSNSIIFSDGVSELE